MGSFNDRLLQIEREIQALKTIRRRTSTTMKTITKRVTATVTFTARQTALGVFVYTESRGYVEITPSDASLPYFFAYSKMSTTQSGGRRITLQPYGENGKSGYLVDASTLESDKSIGAGGHMNVSVSFYITCTQDFTWTASQRRYGA